MNPRTPMVRLARDESDRVREATERIGADAAGRLLGLDARTVRKAACGEAILRLSAEVIRGRLDRI